MTGTRPLVAHLTTTDMSLELLLGPQLEAFRAAGYEVVGLSAPGPYEAALARRGIRHIPLRHATRAMAPGEDARALAELVQIFRALRPTIVHTHNPKPGLYGRFAARIARVPIIVNTVHGLYALPEDPATKRAIVYGLERVATACSDAELLQNPEDAAVLARWKVPAGRVTVLGNGIDLAHFDRSTVAPDDVLDARATLGARASDDVVVGLVGRLVREKGFPEAFAAARLLASSGRAAGRGDAPRRQIRIAVIGPEDPDKAGALTLAERAEAAEAGVVFLGERNDLATLYTGMDLFVLASHREGFPRAAMEAAAVGVPVIATDIRGGRQVVDDGVTGLLIPRSDPRALAAAITTLAEDPDRRAAMAIAARSKAERDFDQETCIDLTLATYRRLLAEAGLPGPASRSSAADHGTVRPAVAADAGTIARLHAEAIAEGFLPSLGHRFLRLLYLRILADPGSFAYVVEDAQGVAGFVAATESTRDLYRSFLRHDGARAALHAAPKLARSPRRVWETWRYGAGDEHVALPQAEVLATAVAPRAQGTGLGTRLLDATISEFATRQVTEAMVVTASTNDAARHLYERAGFLANGSTEVHAGVHQDVLVWR